MSRPLIPKGKRSELLTRIAATESRFVVRAEEILTAFLELESATRPASRITASRERLRTLVKPY